jgi:hypothetical protein
MSGHSKPKPIEDAIKPFTVQEVVDALIEENCFGPVVDAIVSNLTDKMNLLEECRWAIEKLNSSLQQ